MVQEVEVVSGRSASQGLQTGAAGGDVERVVVVVVVVAVDSRRRPALAAHSLVESELLQGGGRGGGGEGGRDRRARVGRHSGLENAVLLGVGQAEVATCHRVVGQQRGAGREDQERAVAAAAAASLRRRRRRLWWTRRRGERGRAAAAAAVEDELLHAVRRGVSLLLLVPVLALTPLPVAGKVRQRRHHLGRGSVASTAGEGAGGAALLLHASGLDLQARRA